MKNFKKFLFLICVFVLNALPLAQATEVLNTNGPTLVSDNKITVGLRTLTLPEVKNGKWYLTSYESSDFMSDGLPNGRKIITSKLSLVVESKIIIGVYLTLLNHSFDGTEMGWNVNLCENNLHYTYFDTYGNRFKNPGCLAVTDAKKIGLDEFTDKWAKENQFALPNDYHIMSLKKFASNDLGMVTVFMSLSSISHEDFLSWSKSFPDALLSFLAKSSFNGQFPAIPKIQ